MDSASSLASPLPRPVRPWLLPLLALLGLLLLTGHDLARGIWRQDEHGYQPLLVLLAGGLLLHDGRQLAWQAPARLPLAGWASLAWGLPAYALGRSQALELLEALACVALIAALILCAGGLPAWRRLRLVLLLLLLALPYPAWVIDGLTAPLKLGITQLVEALLYAAGYPVARSGVMLGLGPYRLLVADACSGLHSLIFLLALGLLYLHLSGPRARWRHALLVASLLPIALLANGLRVLALALTTYHFGDAAGQGLWHDFSGLLLFACALLTLLGLDALLSGTEGRGQHACGSAAPASSPLGVPMAWRTALLLAAGLVASGVLAHGLRPNQVLAERHPPPALASLVPARLGAWQHETQAALALVPPDVQASEQQLYQQTLTRVYVDPQGQRIMLSIAYGSRQRGNALQAHRPEYCYKAQGFELEQIQDSRLQLGALSLPLRRLLARRHQRIEPVSYWMTVGDQAVLPGLDRKWLQLRFGLQGLVPDGLLVRVSSLGQDQAHAYALHDQFIQALLQAAPGLAGSARPQGAAASVSP
jgi:EpsI family protein